MQKDLVNHPEHYTTIAGIECIDVTENFNFNLGNAIKYIWRTYLKDDPIENLEKAIWYCQREIGRIRKGQSNGNEQSVSKSDL